MANRIQTGSAGLDRVLDGGLVTWPYDLEK